MKNLASGLGGCTLESEKKRVEMPVPKDEAKTNNDEKRMWTDKRASSTTII
jgi:hypothetical protein